MRVEIPEALRRAPTSLMSDCLNRAGALSGAIHRLSGTSVRGFAFTVRTMVGESSTLHRAVADAPAGSILVVEAEGYTDRAVWGELLSIAAVQHGIGGLVLDGAVRDIAAIRSLGFTVFARAMTPAGPHKGWQGEWNIPVCCGGVTVAPGDLVVGDDDGVVVIPRNAITRTNAAAAQRLEAEAGWKRRIEAGEPSADVLGLPARDRHE